MTGFPLLAGTTISSRAQRIGFFAGICPAGTVKPMASGSKRL
jgi:hypothetical protein